MAAKQDAMASVHALLECNVAGASLRDRGPEQLRVDELKRRLKCRGASVSGRKSDLVARCVSAEVKWLPPMHF